MLYASCPTCSAKLRLHDRMAGTAVKCPACSKPFFLDPPPDDPLAAPSTRPAPATWSGSPPPVRKANPPVADPASAPSPPPPAPEPNADQPRALVPIGECPACHVPVSVPPESVGHFIECPKCRFAFAALKEDTAATEQVEYARPIGPMAPSRKRPTVAQVIIAIGVFASLPIIIISFRDSAEHSKQRREERRLQREDKELYGDKYEAVRMAQFFVKRRLRFPEEAGFQGCEAKPIDAADDAPVPGRSWLFAGSVITKNAFGVKARFAFVGSIHKTSSSPGSGAWVQVVTTELFERDAVAP